MASELYYQQRICKAIRQERGYARKLSSTYAVGFPDLLVCTSQIMPLFAEVKLEKKWNNNTARTIKLTPKQSQELKALELAGARACVLLLVEKHKRMSMTVLRPEEVAGAIRFDEIPNSRVANLNRTIKNKRLGATLDELYYKAHRDIDLYIVRRVDVCYNDDVDNGDTTND